MTPRRWSRSRYISTVDNGNLASHLIVAANRAASGSTHPTPTAPQRPGFDGLALPAPVAPSRSLDDALLAELDRLLDDFPSAESRSARHSSRGLERSWSEPSHGRVTTPASAACGRQPAGRTGRSAMRRTGATGPVVERNERLARVERRMRNEVLGMDFGFLFDQRRAAVGRLPGRRGTSRRAATTCWRRRRVASYVAIAKGDVQTRHWFRLGRTVTPVPPTPHSSPGQARCSST